MMMQKATDPKTISSAFKAIGVPLEGPAAAGAPQSAQAAHDAQSSQAAQTPEPGRILTGGLAPDSSLASGSRATAPGLDAAQAKLWRATCQDLTGRMLSVLSTKQIETLALAWFSPTMLEQAAASPHWLSLAESTEQQLQTIQASMSRTGDVDSEPPVESLQAWKAELGKFQAEWSQLLDASSSGSPQAFDPIFAQELTSQLDRVLIDGLVDATVWKSAEMTVFWRLLQKGQGGATFAEHSAAPEVNTLQLLADGENLRGKRVRFRGEVRRLTQHVRRSPFTQEDASYWVAWLRGEDRANQPVAAYVPDSIGRMLNAQTPGGADSQQAGDPSYETVEITGFVGKRFAYAGQAGLEVAPTLFASDVELMPGAAAEPQAAVSTLDAPNKILWAAGIALALSGLFVMAVLPGFRRRGRPAARSRSAKRAGMLVLLAASASGATGLLAQTPPWANSAPSTDSIQPLVTERLTEFLTPDTIAAIEATTAGIPPAVAASPANAWPAAAPDGLLKTMRLLSQIGWERALGIKPITIQPGGLVVASERLAGWAESIERVQLSEAQKLWFVSDKTSQLYRITCQLDATQASPGGQTTLYSTMAPASWLGVGKLHQPVEIHGLTLRASADSQPVCVIAELPDWFLPQAATAAQLQAMQLVPTLPEHLRTLGISGWNLASLERIRMQSSKPLSQAEAKTYYAFLRLVAESPNFKTQPSRSSRDAANASFSPHGILQNARGNVGAPVQWKVRLVAGSVVEVTDPLAQQQLGSSRYLQLDGFVDIGNRAIAYELLGKDGEKEKITFEREFPITLVTRDVQITSDLQLIPEAVRQGSQRSWQIGQYVDIQGLYYRLWAYQSDLLDSKSRTARQAAPLVVVAGLSPAGPPERGADAPIGWFAAALCVPVLAFLGLILFLATKKDVRRRPISGPRPPHS